MSALLPGRLSASLSICLYVCLCVSMSICLYICRSAIVCVAAWCLYVCMYAYLYFCISACPYLCLYVCLQVDMSICLHGIGMFACLYVSMSICIYPCLCARVGCVLVPVHMSVNMSSPSVNIPVCLFVNLYPFYESHLLCQTISLSAGCH